MQHLTFAVGRLAHRLEPLETALAILGRDAPARFDDEGLEMGVQGIHPDPAEMSIQRLVKHGRRRALEPISRHDDIGRRRRLSSHSSVGCKIVSAQHGSLLDANL